MKKCPGFLLVALIPLFASCSLLWSRDNVVDPGNTSSEDDTSYQGYTTVARSSEIENVEPENGEYVDDNSRLTFSEVKGADGYEFVVADSVANLDSSPYEQEYLGSNADGWLGYYPPNKYYWKVRARFERGWDTSWSPVFYFYAK
jgi:hypothetical protein